MNKTLLVLILLPAFGWSQDANDQYWKNYLHIHFEKIALDDNGNVMTNFTHPGQLTICDSNSIHVDGPVVIGHHERKRMNTDYWLITASKVEIASPTSPVLLKADKLSYDYMTKRGTLTGHVAVVDNGVEKKLGQSAEVYLTKNDYKIITVK